MTSSQFHAIDFNSFPQKPGIYRMSNAAGKVLYVGKAKNLKKRLQSYLRATDSKTQALITQVEHVATTVTASENEALLLEANLIKNFKPRYNIVFKDDRSFPYLWLSHHPYPRFSIFRGARKTGDYFGPFPHAQIVREVFHWLQKIFKLRSCSDSYFRHRSRPCLQYQIKRCTAPCVGLINEADYQQRVTWVKLFLTGKSSEIIENLSQTMEVASRNQNYEKAAQLRDQIANLKKIQQQQYMVVGGECVDVMAVVTQEGLSAINVLQVRAGLVLWDKTYFLEQEVIGEMLASFISQYYLSFKLPTKIVVNLKLPDRLWLEKALHEQFTRPIKINDQARGVYAKWNKMAENNAREFLIQKLASANKIHEQLAVLSKILQLQTVARIECFDVSHTSGEATVVADVVLGLGGFIKSDYRKFNVKSSAGDDYGALKEAIFRRYRTLKKVPDILMIDGGKGQLQVAQEIIQQLKLSKVVVLAIAKGLNRNHDMLYTLRGQLQLARDSAAFNLLQRIRDEAHRFAISSHRKKFLKKRTHSQLEEIAGIGRAKCIRLLHQFGGLANLKTATVEQLATVKGIGEKLASHIYQRLHE